MIWARGSRTKPSFSIFTSKATPSIDDILKLIDDYFLVSTLDDDLHHLHYGQLVWLAVPIDEYPQRGKTIAATRIKPVVLSFVTDDDIGHIAHGFDSKTLRKKRLVRWVDEAFDIPKGCINHVR